MQRSTERGQAVPLVAVVLALAAAVALVVGELGVAAVERARARTAADAAALAGAATGEAEAAAVAAANGARLVRYDVDGAVVAVEVALGRARAVATAEGRRAPRAGTTAAVAAALARAEQLLGRPVPVLAVVDGGAAVAVDDTVAAALDVLAPDSGLCRQPRAVRPVHFGPCPPSSTG